MHEIIEEQVQACARLLGLAQAEREALVAGDVAALEAAVTGEAAALRTLGRLELRYAAACAELARVHGLDPEDVQGRPIALLEPAHAARAAPALLELAGLAGRLAAIADVNRRLTQSARAYVDFSLGQLGRMAYGAAYDENGSAPPPAAVAAASPGRRV